MKKYFSLMAIAAAVMLGFASCSDDEGSTNPTTPGGSTMADNVAGIYDCPSMAMICNPATMQ